VNGPTKTANARWERAVLTFHFAFAKRPVRAARAIGAALVLSLLSWCAGLTAAQAQMLGSGGCIGDGYSLNCADRYGPAGDPYLRQVPQPLDAAAIARAQQREKRWAERCHPVIALDRYGVSRYRYAQPGCEFGVGED
jgi:hypothetical protein